MPKRQTLPWSETVEEVVAIGAAVAANCMPCLKYHTDKARALGVSDGDMAKAVAIGNAVKQRPAEAIMALANRYLKGKIAQAVEGQTCCTGGPRGVSRRKR